MKKKSSNKYCVRLNALGNEQQIGVHFDGNAIAAPVVTDMTISIVMVIMIMAAMCRLVVDVKGAFLKGNSKPWEQLIMKVP